MMDEAKIIEYLNILLSSNIEPKNLLLMVYDLLHDRYSPAPLNNIDDLRREEVPIDSIEFEVPVARQQLHKSLPALIVASYSDRVTTHANSINN